MSFKPEKVKITQVKEPVTPVCNFEKIIMTMQPMPNRKAERATDDDVKTSKSSYHLPFKQTPKEIEKKDESREASSKIVSEAGSGRCTDTRGTAKVAMKELGLNGGALMITSHKKEADDLTVETTNGEKQRQTSQLAANPAVLMQNPIVSLHDVIRIFVHGKYLQKPLNSIREATFPAELHKNLRAMKFQSVFRTQAHAWPQILEGRSTFIINSERTGKTFTYLPALLSNILYEEEDKEVPPKAQGPIGIIVVRSSRDVENIYKLCRQMVPREKMEIIQAFGKWNCENTKVHLLNGCDLLITTPPCFSRLAQSDVIRMFSKDRIKFLVLDGLHEMNASFEQEMRDIMKTCTKGSEYPDLNPQLIVTSTSWMNYLRGYMALTCDPVMIFGSFVEAALFAKCRFKVCKKTHEEKLNTLWTQLKTNEHVSAKTLVLFNSQAELEAVSDFFRNRGIGFLAVSKFSYTEESLIRDWVRERVDNMSIMLATDEAIGRLVIKCVQNLIHFSLPNTMTTFSHRFATMLDRFTESIEGKANEPLRTIVMLDEDNGVEIPRLVNFLSARQVLRDIPEDVNDLVEQLIEEREVAKRDPMYESIMPICTSVFLYGSCPNMPSCKNRHAFTGADRPKDIPYEGLVKFELVATRSPAHYYIKVLEYHLTKENKWISCEKKIKRIESSLESLQELMKESPLIQVGVKTNDICAVFVPKLVKWCRCKVLEKESTERSVFKAIVHLIDSGEKLIVRSTDLKALPSHLKALDPLLNELRIVDLVPYDLDPNFDHTTTSEVEKFFTHRPKEGEYKILKVEFAAQNIIFAKTFEIRRRIDDLSVDVTKFSLRAKLLKEDFCLKDTTVTDKLKMLLKRANIYIPPTVVPTREEVPVEEKKTVEEAEPRWKSLTVGSEYQVVMREFVSPCLFYVHVNPSGNQVLPKLMRKVHGCNTRLPINEIKTEDFCLVAKPNQKARRGVIEKVKQTSVRVFLLDEGETIRCKKTDVYQLPASIINIAPFQSIQCRLVGVKPKHGLSEWNSQSAEAFNEFINECCFEQVIKLRVVARHNIGYDVSLFDPRSGESLHKLAVQKGLADLAEIEEEKSDIRSDTSEISSNSDQKVTAMDEETPGMKLVRLLESHELDIELSELLGLVGLPETARLIPPDDVVASVADAPAKEKHEIEEKSGDETKAQTSTQKSQEPNTVVTNYELPSRLSYIHKHPKIEWRQDNSMVLMHILATDCVDYALNGTDSAVKIHIKYEGSGYEYTVVQLYGCVEPDLMSHEKSGGKVIVRIVKSLDMVWPRLTKSNEPNRFIKHSHEGLPSYLNEAHLQNPRYSAMPAGASDSGSDFGDLPSDNEL